MTVRVSNEVLLEAYARLGNVHKVGAEVGIRGGSVHERLVRLGVQKPIDRWTEAEDEVLLRDYPIMREHGRGHQLAEELGRPLSSLSRRAKQLGIVTDNRHRRLEYGKWKYISEEAARAIFDDFKASSLTLAQFCARHGYSDDGLLQALRTRWPDEWEAVIESKAPLLTKYRRGRQFEYACRDQLVRAGYFVMRSPASRSPIDLVAIAPGIVLMVQCKRGGALGPAEWNSLFDLASSCGAVPVLAETPVPRRTLYWRMLSRKDGTKRAQPRVELKPADLVHSTSGVPDVREAG